MHSLTDCVNQLDKLLPGITGVLNEIPFQIRESEDGVVLGHLKRLGAAKLAVSTQCRGDGVHAPELVAATIGLASIAPSAAVGLNMHHFSVAALEALRAEGDSKVWALLEAVSTQNLFVASGFAEGTSGRSVVEPKIVGTRTGEDYVVTGSKKPCSLARSMDILSLSISLSDDSSSYGVAIVPASSPGISVRNFWNTPVLAAAESHQVILTDVVVPDELVIKITKSAVAEQITVQDVGFVWFELLMCGAYLGILGRLVVLAIASTDAPQAQRISAEYSSTVRHVLNFASEIDNGIGPESLSSALALRCVVETFIERAVPHCLDAIGGIEFVTNPEIQYLASAVQCLRFHPPSMSRMPAQSYAHIAEGTFAHVQ